MKARCPLFASRLAALLAVALAGLVPARGADTVTTTPIGIGLVYKHYHYDSLYGARQEVYVLDADLAEPSVRVKFAQANGGTTVPAFARFYSGVLGAVNGQFFDPGNNNVPVQYLKIDGKFLFPSQYPLAHDEQAVTVGANNAVNIMARPSSGWDILTDIPNIMSCGPALFADGSPAAIPSGTVYDYRASRTVAANTYDNHFLLICTDASASGSGGFNGAEIQGVLPRYGSIRNCMSLDGGGSTTMWVTGGIVTKTNPTNPRTVADAIDVIANTATLGVPAAGVVGGDTGAGTVGLVSPVAYDVTAFLSSSSAVASVPASVVLPAGQTSVAFPMSTQGVTGNATATITATVLGIVKTATLTVKPIPPPTLSIDPASLVGGGTATGTFAFYNPVPSAVTVTLSSDNAAVPTPYSTTVPMGASSATFSISTRVVNAAVTAHVFATAGSQNLQASVTLLPLVLTHLYIAPDTISGGQPATGTVVVGNPVPMPDGLSVALHSDNPAVGVPSVVTIPQGQTGVDFPIATQPTAQGVTAGISATLNSATLTTLLSITPVTGDVNLDGVFDLNDVTFTLQLSAGLTRSTPDTVMLADADYDGQLTLADAAALLRQLEGL